MRGRRFRIDPQRFRKHTLCACVVFAEKQYVTQYDVWVIPVRMSLDDAAQRRLCFGGVEVEIEFSFGKKRFRFKVGLSDSESLLKTVHSIHLATERLFGSAAINERVGIRAAVLFYSRVEFLYRGFEVLLI